MAKQNCFLFYNHGAVLQNGHDMFILKTNNAPAPYDSCCLCLIPYLASLLLCVGKSE